MSGYLKKPCPNDASTCMCRICWLFLNEIKANIAYGGNGILKKKMFAELKMRLVNPCAHLGERIQDENSCGCGKSPKYQCSVYGTCKKMLNDGSEVQSCLNCSNYMPRN